jgi:hypothetical protein
MEGEMKRKLAAAALLCLALVATMALAVAPAQAILRGSLDTGNKYSNVGLNLEYGGWVDGWWGLAASCTLVKNEPDGDVIVLLAAHQLQDVDAAETNCVTFEPVPEFGWYPVFTGEFLPVGLETYDVIHAEVHPLDLPDVPMTMSKMKGIGPGQEDVALMWLDRPVTVPDSDELVVPADIVERGGLDDLDLKSETFDVAGYGFSDILLGALPAWYKSPPFYTFARETVAWTGRNYKEGVRAIPESGPFADRYLKLERAMTNFDSGGPVFHDGTIVALCSWAVGRGDLPEYNYRLDTDSARDFLDTYLLD